MKNNKFVIIIFLFNIFLTSLYGEVLLFSKAYQRALENAHGLKSSIYMSQSDTEKIAQEKSQFYPQVNLTGYFKKTQYVSNPLKTESEQGLYNYTLKIRQTIFNAEVYAKIGTQKLRSEYSKTKVFLEKEQLAQNVFSTYLDVLKSKNKIELLKSYLKYNTSKLQELTKKYEMNLANKMDLLQGKVEFNSAQIDLDKEKKLFNVFNLKLKQYIGEIKYEIATIDLDKPILEMINSMKKNINRDKESLKIIQAQISLKVTQGEINSAQNAHFPKMYLDASYARYETDDPNIEALYNNTKYAMLTLDIPIYSGGYTSSKVASLQLINKAAQEDLNRIKKEVEIEYNEYLAFFEASIESITMYKEALKSAKLYVQAINQGYEHGLKSVLDLNDAKNKFYEVKYKYIENIYEMVNSYIGLLIVSNNFENINILDTLVE